MILRGPEIREQDNASVCRVKFSCRGTTQELWFAVRPGEPSLMCADRQDAFVAGLLPLAMHLHEDMQIEGVLSERLYYHISEYVMPMMKILNPSHAIIRLRPEALSSGCVRTEEGKVAMGFSAGVDSLCTLREHLRPQTPANYRVQQLFFNHVGAHGCGPAGRKLFAGRCERVRPAARELGLPMLCVDSNLSDVLPFDFLSTSSLRNLAAVLLLQKLVKRYYYSSSYRYSDSYVRRGNDFAHMDPFVDHLFSTESTEFVSAGCQYSRAEKTRRIADWDIAQRYLTVCLNEHSSANCSTCPKCARTCFTLELLGKLEAFHRVFDLDMYRRIRHHYMRQVLLDRENPYQREIAEFANELGYQYPTAVRACVVADKVTRPLRRAVPKPLRQGIRSLLAAGHSLPKAFRQPPLPAAPPLQPPAQVA